MSQKYNFLKILYYSIAVFAHLFFINWLHGLFPLFFLKRVCYLTTMSLYLNTIYYSSMLLVNLKLINFHRKVEIGYFKFCYVISFVVFIQYWGMIFLKPDLLLKGSSMMPFTLDIFLHGVNFVLNLAEAKLIDPKENYTFTFLFYILFCCGYGLTLKLLFHVFDYTVYPFVAASHLEYVIILIMAFGTLMVGDLSYNRLTHHHHKKIHGS
jgi:hypothetical protein